MKIDNKSDHPRNCCNLIDQNNYKTELYNLLSCSSIYGYQFFLDQRSNKNKKIINQDNSKNFETSLLFIPLYVSDHQFYHKWALLTDPDDTTGGPKGEQNIQQHVLY